MKKEQILFLKYAIKIQVLAKKYFPDLADQVSQELTPMVATARSIKQEHPNAKVVFIGPCASKKLEAARRTVRSDVDFVITFEELQGMFDALETEAHAHSHTFTYDCPIKGDTRIFADKERIEQVMTNIIGNAIKYTPDGGKISVCLDKTFEADYKITVSDTGVGIPEEDLEHLFERFYRVDKSRSTNAGGTGLGLSIAKDIIDAHNGTISVDSVYGKGTTVTIVLPTDTRISNND